MTNAKQNNQVQIQDKYKWIVKTWCISKVRKINFNMWPQLPSSKHEQIVNFGFNIFLLYKITLELDTSSETVTAIPQQMLTMFDDNIGLLAERWKNISRKKTTTQRLLLLS